MDTMYKYRVKEQEYLIYDLNDNPADLDGRMVRTICAQNFGLGTMGVLAGPVFYGGRMTMQHILPDGSCVTLSEESRIVADTYLVNAGYLKTRKPENEDVVLAGKVYLYMDLGHQSQAEIGAA